MSLSIKVFYFFCIPLNYRNTLQALGNLLFFIPSLTPTCILTWKNVSTCCLGASSLRTGYVHLPIISYIAFIISSISWKVKGTHMRLHVLYEETTLTDYSYSISNFFFFCNFSLNAFWLSQRKSQQFCALKAAGSEYKN